MRPRPFSEAAAGSSPACCVYSVEVVANVHL